jgi:hypothetical protein
MEIKEGKRKKNEKKTIGAKLERIWSQVLPNDRGAAVEIETL